MRVLLAVAAAATVTVSAAHPVAKIRVAPLAQPCAAAAGGRWVWVAEYGQPRLLKIDPRTNKVVSAAKIGGGACGLDYGAGSMWVEDTSSNTVSRVSVRTGKRTAIPVGLTPYDATFAYGAAWVTAHNGNELDRVDPAHNRVVARIGLPGALGVVAAFGSVWATGTFGVIRVDPATNRVVARIDAELPAWTAASPDAVWVTEAGKLLRIDPATNAVAATIRVPQIPGDPDVVGGKIWVPIVALNEVVVVDPATNTVVQTVKTGAGPFVVTAIAGQAWVPSYHGADVWRIAP